MDANILGLGFLGAIGMYFSYISMNSPSIVNVSPVTPWGEQVGKTHAIQSMHGDASMSTELLRRKTIQTVGRLKPMFLKENRTQLGTATGAVETFMIRRKLE